MVLTSALVFFYFRDFINALLDWTLFRDKRNMARSDVQRCMDWLCQTQEELQSAPYGKGKLSVLEALAVHHSKVKDIVNFKTEFDEISALQKPDEPSLEELKGVYNTVKALSEKRNCLIEIVNQIASLEDNVQTLSAEFDARSVHLVSTMDVTKDKDGLSQTNESLARTVQGCISSVRQNWKWIFQLTQCAELHLRNAATYQEFFQEVEEAEYWLQLTLSQLQAASDRSSPLTGSQSDGQPLLQEFSEVLAAYLQWQTKIEYLFDKAKQVVPVHQRIRPLTSSRPVIALTDFKTSEIEFIEGETLTLLDNSDRKKWKVKTETGQTGVVPAVIILITGPTPEAVDTVIRLKLQLLSFWTLSLKRFGVQLISYLLLVFRDWTDAEVQLLRQLSSADKKKILQIIQLIEATLGNTWAGYPGYQELQKRLSRLRTILEESLDSGDDQSGEANNFSESLLGLVLVVEDLLIKYKEFWSFWQIFRSLVETLKQPRFLLVCDKWEQLRFITSAQFVRFWETTLDISDMVSEPIKEEPIEPAQEEPVNSDITLRQKKEESTTDTVTSTLEEEQHTFIIKGVLDPRDNSTQLSLEEAISQGVVDETQKFYINPKTGQKLTMSDAMNEGRVMVEFISRKKIREEQNTYGIITITITKETKPYTITSILDPLTDEKLTVAQALAKNILDKTNSTYRTEKGELMPVADAIQSGLVLVQYHEGVTVDKEPEVETKTYAVYGVVDQKKKSKVSFSDAVRDGLLSRDNGDYINNVTSERVGVHEAILKGFIKARIVSDPSKLEVNPENTIVVERLSTTRTKLLKSVKAVKAFKAGDV